METLRKSALEKEVVKSAARGRWLDIFRHIGIPGELLDGKGHPCPKCRDGENRFSVVDEREGALLCRHCLHGENGDGLSAIAWWLGLDIRSDLPSVIGVAAGYLGLPEPVREAAPLAVRGRAYQALLDALTLSDEHREDLLARGLTNEQIDRGGYRTLPHPRSRLKIVQALKRTGAALADVPGFYIDERTGNDNLAGSIGLLVPARAIGGAISAIRVRTTRGKERDYTYLSSKSYRGAAAVASIHIPLGIVGPCETVRITEGELKADIATILSGIPTLSTPGVGSWKLFFAVLEQLGTKKVLLSYDRDQLSKKSVAQAFIKTYEALIAAGYEVAIEVWDGPKGIDDALQAGVPTELLYGDAAAGELDFARQVAGDPTDDDAGESKQKRGPRPKIVINTNESDCIDATIAVIAERTSDLYQRGGRLVRVIPAATKSLSPTLQEAPEAAIRTAITRAADVVTKGGSLIHPPRWLPHGVFSAGNWPGVRQVNAIVEAPVLRADGTILQTPGHDPLLSVVYIPNKNAIPPIPEFPTKAEIESAREAIEYVIIDFPFEDDRHRAAFIAGLLTPLARFAFEGPAPLTLIEGNKSGSGKGMLAHIIAIIATGHKAHTTTYKHDDNEMRKTITAIAKSGQALACFDNIVGRFGQPCLDAALTSTVWKERLITSNDNPSYELRAVWLATGNNVHLWGDMPRRVLRVRLRTRLESPGRRTDLHELNILKYVLDNRPRLLSAAITLLRGWFAAGRPRRELSGFGTFDDWSDLVRQCVVWLGYEDPALTRDDLEEEGTEVNETLSLLLEGWRAADPDAEGMLVARAIALAQELFNGEPAYPLLRRALELMGQKGALPSGPQLGYFIRSHKEEPVGGLQFEKIVDHTMKGTIWCVRTNEESIAAKNVAAAQAPD